MSKTPLQAAVMVICDCLCQLPDDDRARALEAVRVTLGLSAPSTRSDPAPPGYQAPRQPPEEEPELRQAWERDPPARGRLPTVVVQMMNGRPVIANQQVGRPGPALVVVGPQRDRRQQLPASRLRQLPAPRPLTDHDEILPDEILPARPRRGGFVRPTR
jgi:hypothetical protein